VVSSTGIFCPGQRFELPVQVWLVLLDREHVTRLVLGQPAGVFALGVQSVGGDDRPGQVESGQQRLEPGDFVGFTIDVGLREHHPGVLVDRGQQMHLIAWAAAAPQRLAVHGDHSAGYGTGHGGRAVDQPPPDRGVQRVRVDPAQQPPDRRRVRRHPGPGPRIPRRPSDPRTASGRSAAHSPIAAVDICPAATAATATARGLGHGWITPRGSRGSGTCATTPSSPDPHRCASPDTPCRRAASPPINDDDATSAALPL
jgi:hypothetical protein